MIYVAAVGGLIVTNCHWVKLTVFLTGAQSSNYDIETSRTAPNTHDGVLALWSVIV